jgi:hypothetical protein
VLSSLCGATILVLKETGFNNLSRSKKVITVYGVKNTGALMLNSLPINTRVWYPEGDGPFPLALIVHGNHNMQDYSDPGHEYLGELLASKGIILASVDENFINYSWSDILGD